MRERFDGLTGREATFEVEPEQLRIVLAHLAEQENERLGARLIDADGRVAMDVFRIANGGPYKKEDEKADAAFVVNKEIEWSGLADARVRDFRVKEYGVETEGRTASDVTRDVLTAWEAHQARHPGSLAEQAVTALLAKVLQKQFLVVRTAKYDDYANHVDQLVVNRETGDVVCAFDEVSGIDAGDRVKEKDRRVLGLAMRNGTRIKYGLTFSGGKVMKRAFDHVPTFRLAIDRAELDQLIRALTSETGTEVSDGERDMFNQLVASLESQRTRLMHERLPAPMLARLEQFGQSLDAIRSAEPSELKLAASSGLTNQQDAKASPGVDRGSRASGGAEIVKR